MTMRPSACSESIVACGASNMSMSYIATANDVSIVPDSCHCHDVPGCGCQIDGGGIAPSGCDESPSALPSPGSTPVDACRDEHATTTRGSQRMRAPLADLEPRADDPRASRHARPTARDVQPRAR